MDEDVDTALRLKDRFFMETSALTTSASLHMKLEDQLAVRGVVPHIAWIRWEAIAALGDGGKRKLLLRKG